MNALCRDCGALETAPHQSERCASCGSPTLFERELNGPRRLEHAIDAIRGRLGGGRSDLGARSPAQGWRLAAASDQIAPPIPTVIASDSEAISGR
ncbi:MAG TPA: hypothetical protein VH230_03485 [Stellaceae bacterium]|nr:hypothetical protein [Stellaceae bacterium]